MRYGETIQIYRNQLTFDVSEADNVQIFEGREALASPLPGPATELIYGRSAWQTIAIGSLGLLLSGFVIYLVVSIYQYEKEKKLRKQKIGHDQGQKQQQNPQRRPLPTKPPIRAPHSR
ncbi:MAG: hypothetical protein IPM53_14080 [Anaerolineaceae bacterium]|nr:hypothetical protein [Anaerolineaceae bacterium]